LPSPLSGGQFVREIVGFSPIWKTLGYNLGMKLTIDIPDYDPQRGLPSKWVGDFVIETSYDNGEFVIWANKDGLLSLANDLLILAQDEVPSGNHHHYDPVYGLTENSISLVIGKRI
jgi:hypothetical protein